MNDTLYVLLENNIQTFNNCLVSVLLQLLTQRKAVERVPPNKNVQQPLCRTLKKDGLLSDPEKLMEKAQQVMREILISCCECLN